MVLKCENGMMMCIIAKRLTIFVRPERERVGRTKVSVSLCGSVAIYKSYSPSVINRIFYRSYG
jgi:hypothetical protein